MKRLYGPGPRLNRAQFVQYRQRYRPHGTVASFYLWALAGLPTVVAPRPPGPTPTQTKIAAAMTPAVPLLRRPTATEYFFAEGCFVTEWWNTSPMKRFP